MPFSKESSSDDPPELAYARQLQTGFPRLSFVPALEQEFRRVSLDQAIGHVRANVVFAIVLAIAFAATEAPLLGSANLIPSLMRVLIVVPTLSIVLGVSFSPRRHALYAPMAISAAMICGLCHAAIQVVAMRHGSTFLFPSMVLAIIYTYLMAGLIFHHALTVNVSVMLVYLAAMSAQLTAGFATAGTAAGLQSLTAGAFSYDALAIVAANLVGASVAFLQEKTSRMRFLEAGLLREMVARDHLTGIQNRRMFDEHILRCWQQAVRETQCVAVLLVDIDCFKLYNDRYGHQAGDESLRAVALALVECVRRPLDFVARYGGEEFAIVLYEVSREYVAEVLVRIQLRIAELNIPHEASLVAARLTVSIGAAYILPGANRTPEGLVQLADEALYNAKEQGRNRVVLMEAEYQNLRTGRFDKRRSNLAG